MAKAATKQAKSGFRKATDEAFREVYADTPASVERSGKTGAAKTAMLRAIALSKARQKASK